VVIERRAEDPILPLSFLKRPVIRMGTIIGALMGAVMMGAIMYTPLFMQAVLGATPTEAGTTIAPMLIGWPIMSAISGRLLPRFGYRPLVRLGLAVVGVGAIALFFGLRHAHAASGEGGAAFATWLVRGAAFLMGAGMGLANTAVIIAVQESVSHGQRGVATASTMFARSIGGAVIVGALGAILGAMLLGKIPNHLLDELLAPEGARHTEIAPELLRTYQLAIFDGMVPLFAIVAVLGALTAIAGFGFPALQFRKSNPDDEPASDAKPPSPNTELHDVAAG